MEGKRIICLFLFIVLILVFSSCHPRHVSDIKLAMTKEEVVSLWERTNLITYKTVNGTTLETWEYHFAGSGSICRITFIQDRVATNPQCDRPPVGGWYYSQSGQNKPQPPPIEQSLVREGSFAMKLVEALKMGQAKSEAEAESMLASVGIAPRNGWVADYPLTPDIIGELRNAIGVALDSGKLAMNKDEAMMAVQVLVDNQWRHPVAPGKEQARQYAEYPPAVYEGYEGGYEPYYYPYYYPYPYYYGGYYYLGGFGGRGFRGGSGGFHGGGGRGGGSHGGGHR
jgi:hypothetical protein